MVSLSRALALLFILPLLLAGASSAAPAASASGPHIFTVEVSTKDVRAGQTVFGHVTTSWDVASVEARVVGYSALLAKRGAGDFLLDYTLPSAIPWYLRGKYTLSVIARTTQGVATTRELPVVLH